MLGGIYINFLDDVKKSKPVIMAVNDKGVIESVNIDVKKIFGNTNIVNCKFEDIFSFELEELHEKRNVFLSNSRMYFISASRMETHGIEVTVVILEDVTRLNEDEKHIYCYDEIFSKIDDGLLMSDEEGRISLYNKAQEELEGLKQEDCIGRHLWEVYNYVSTESSEHRSVFKSQVPINEYKAHVKDGNVEKYLAYATYPITKEDESIAVFSVSKNESMLLDLLSETIELKRRIKGEHSENYNDNGTFYTFNDIKGNSDSIKKTIRDAEQLSLMTGNLLIIGETGVGKEMFAQSIHNISKNKKEKFFAVNCAALPENLLESTLFGTVKGSFTGSVEKDGYFDAAGKGTLFLDELNSMPMYMQTKLLRVLQEKRFRKVGGLESKPIECRIICAINEEPDKLISEGRLREDLYYRISRLCLLIPPLRERQEDIQYLTNYFISKYNEILNKNIIEVSNDLKGMLFDYVWPGNVRELDHVIENLVISSDSSETKLTSEHLPGFLKNKILKEKNMRKAGSNSLPETLNELERRLIVEALNRFNWNITKASEYLGIIRQSMIYRIKKLNITKENDYWGN
ncbi:arginine utilization regulatory protein [Dethiosulfatibacter aminovorans DSM 17477]|uniref:Arginine utilization regulatory protein n=1 Tax=Dethiosulfatibacter aminovorans DSM 17477 TaxID=1121476 RepID=A0A1M6MZZ0_9FIRM|nr:sigma 54-interacting transcriptional regulator [Dethiosulfatibacter aminovorans]SHJ88994.1 arginine utilization regulatory protein [Dethiosulfatibacter aminovorans DSM 17477]